MNKLRFLTTGLLLLGALILGSSFANAITSKAADDAGLSVLVPTERAVYQRNEKNKADLLIRVRYEADKHVTAALFDADGTVCSETVSLSAAEDDAAVYEGTIPNSQPAAGTNWTFREKHPQTAKQKFHRPLKRSVSGKCLSQPDSQTPAVSAERRLSHRKIWYPPLIPKRRMAAL